MAIYGIVCARDLPEGGMLDRVNLVAHDAGHLRSRGIRAGVEIVQGPVMRTGATSRIRSVYVRDPDLSLVEISAPA